MSKQPVDWCKVDPEYIATTCSPRHIQSVLEDAQRDNVLLLKQIAALMAALEKLADYPLEDFGMGNKPASTVLFGAHDWDMTVGDVKRAREAYAQAKELM